MEKYGKFITWQYWYQSTNKNQPLPVSENLKNFVAIVKPHNHKKNFENDNNNNNNNNNKIGIDFSKYSHLEIPKYSIIYSTDLKSNDVFNNNFSNKYNGCENFTNLIIKIHLKNEICKNTNNFKLNIEINYITLLGGNR